MSRTDQPSSTTTAVRAGIESDTEFGAVVPPLHLSFNFTFRGLGDKRDHDYTRTGNPTRDLLAEALAELEGGAGAVVTSSGMAAITACLELVADPEVLPDNGRPVVLAPHDCYGGTHRLLRTRQAQQNLDVRFIDQTTPGRIESELAQLDRRPKLVWIETPSNPLLRITDLERATEAARSAGALSIVDNTFLSPIGQQPITLGADVVVHSTTKYVHGHSDVVGGAAIAATPKLAERLQWWANCLGLTGAPFDSWLTIRGLRTLPARMRIHEDNAMVIAEWLAQQPGVRRVHFPGLAAHPQHQLAARQHQGFGGMLSFELARSLDAAALVSSLQLFSLAESLGGVESLIAHPASMTHAAMDDAARRAAGIRPDLLRLSIGIESTDDLIGDLRRGLDHATN